MSNKRNAELLQFILECEEKPSLYEERYGTNLSASVYCHVTWNPFLLVVCKSTAPIDWQLCIMITILILKKNLNKINSNKYKYRTIVGV